MEKERVGSMKMYPALGCGLEWHEPQPVAGDETVYKGAVASMAKAKIIMR